MSELSSNEFLDKVRPVERLGNVSSSWWLYRTAFGIVEQNPERIPLAIEVGVWSGGTAIPLALAGMQVIAVDTFRATDEFSRSSLNGRRETLTTFWKNLLDYNLSDRVTVIAGESLVVASYLAHVQADLLFIDADHERQQVLDDLSSWSLKLRSRALMCGHDYKTVHYMADLIEEWRRENGWPAVQEGPDGLWFVRKP